MQLFWGKGATKHQKIINATFIITSIGTGFVIFTHNFVASPNIARFSIYASLALTLVSMAIVRYWYTKGWWSPAPTWYKSSLLKKIILLLLTPLFVFALFWSNLGTSIPQLFTAILGTYNVEKDIVIKSRHYSRRKCHYQLEPKSIDAIFFHYCISESLYNRLPTGEIEAELILKQSALGYTVEDIRPLHQY